MRKNLKISYGGITEKVVATLGLTALVITLGSMYSCSSDGEYEEPWLNMEHRTRAGIMTYENEDIDITGKRIFGGNTTFTIGTEPKCEVDVSWTDGYVGGWQHPQSTISITAVRLADPFQGYVSVRQYNLLWNGGTRHIEGSIEVEGNYIPEHVEYNLYFRYTAPVSVQASPVIYGD